MLSDYDYIAIFDADFKPEPDFLVRMHGHKTIFGAARRVALLLLLTLCHLNIGHLHALAHVAHQAVFASGPHEMPCSQSDDCA